MTKKKTAKSRMTERILIINPNSSNRKYDSNAMIAVNNVK